MMGSYMKSQNYAPQLILCSSARRTTETLDLIKPFLRADAQLRYEDALYLAEPEQLLERLNWIDDEVASAMLIGHNPGMEQLAHLLARAPKSAQEKLRNAQMAEKFPTAALAVLTFQAETWGELRPGKGALVDFMRPKDLDGVESD
ncbi:MAG TPA: histidine phosphatase family protein [Alphaproteobacteria bacterium]|nr:histidine phosphatase family protein [Alphaproteobacteria bacterium]